MLTLPKPCDDILAEDPDFKRILLLDLPEPLPPVAAASVLMPSNGGAQLQALLDAIIKCATNYFISCIPSYTLRYGWYRRVLGWYIGPNTAILMGQHVDIRSVPRNGRRVSIGADSVIEHNCLLSTEGGLLIGEHVYISPGVWLLSENRDISDPQFAATHEPIVIDDYAWIGPRAIILGGVTIGRGAVVLAGAVVTQDVEPNGVVGGIPAKVVTTRRLMNPSYSLEYRPLFE